MSNKILQLHAKFQAARKRQANEKTSISDRMKQNAKSRNIGIGPNVKALIDIFGNTMKDIFNDPVVTDDNGEIDWDSDISFNDEFHYATASPPTTPK